MQVYRVTGTPIAVGNCRIALNARQARARAHKLEFIKELNDKISLYQLTGITHFKKNEEFALDEEPGGKFMQVEAIDKFDLVEEEETDEEKKPTGKQRSGKKGADKTDESAGGKGPAAFPG